MNNVRRKAIKDVIKKLEALQEDFNLALEELQEIRDAEEEAMGNMPDSLQDTDRYYAMEEACDNLNNAVDALEYIDFDDIFSYLDDAMN